MSAHNSQLNPDWDHFEEEDDNSPSLREVFSRTLKHWPWFLASVILFTGLGVLLILVTPKSYTENAQVVIKNDSEGGSSAVSDFNDLGLFSRNTNVMNEIATMASPDITEEVVKMLNLTVDYYEPGTFHKKALYGKTLPVEVSFPTSGDQESLKFKLNIDGKGKYELTKLKKYESQTQKWLKSGKEYTGTLGAPLRTEYGTILVTPTAQYGAGKDYEIQVHKKSLASTINSYNKKVKVALDDDDSTVIDLSISDQNRQRADEVLAATIAVYNENWINEKNQIATSTSQFIDDRLGVIEGELGNVDSDISRYKSENLMPDVQTMTASYVKEQEELTKMIVEAEGQLQAARTLRSRMTMSGPNSALPANTTVENPALQGQIKDYNELILKRNTLESKSSEKNPGVQQLDAEIAQLRMAILASVDNAIQGLEGQIRTLQSAKGSATGRLASSPTQAKYLLSVERQQKVKENLYLFLLQKREDNELNQAFTAYNTRIIKKPGGDGAPTSPKKAVILFGFFLIGVLIPVGYNYAMLTFDTKVRSRQDLEDLKTPMIGEIPFDKKGTKVPKGEDPKLVVSYGRRDTINEAFRVTRTNIEFTKVHKDGCNIIAMTSFNPASGKSFIAMNLGASLALKGKKVLVVDGDLRRGSTSEYVGNPANGLTDYLAGHKQDIERLIVSYPEAEGLYVMPVGKVPPNPTELVESPRFADLMEKLRKDFDYIIIDCPPIEVVADAHIIDNVADRTIFVLRVGLLDKSLLRDLDKFYSEKKYKNLSYILNGTDNDKIAYGSTKGYNY